MKLNTEIKLRFILEKLPYWLLCIIEKITDYIAKKAKQLNDSL